MSSCVIKNAKKNQGNSNKHKSIGSCPCGCYGKDIKRVPFPYKDNEHINRKSLKSIAKNKRRELSKLKRNGHVLYD